MSDRPNPSNDHGTAPDCAAADPRSLLTRRRFLFAGSAAVATVMLPVQLLGRAGVTRAMAQVAEYDRELIGQLSDLEVGAPVPFRYPWDDAQAENLLIKMGQESGGGVGPDNDVVAFNTWCTHQGGPLADKFQADPGVAGPCPLHWTTFDLTRHGMVTSGHATLGLPQIVLETDGDDIYATGVMGLIFGYYDNHVDPASPGG